MPPGKRRGPVNFGLASRWNSAPAGQNTEKRTWRRATVRLCGEWPPAENGTVHVHEFGLASAFGRAVDSRAETKDHGPEPLIVSSRDARRKTHCAGHRR